MNFILNNELEQRIAKLLILTFPADVERGVVEIYYGDGYAEYPMRYFDVAGDQVEPVSKGWDSTEMVAQSDLVKLLSKEVRSLRDGLSKADENYWNHVLFVVDGDLNCDYKFSYQPELDEQEEAKMRASIGDELFEKYERERKEKAAAFATGDSQVEEVQSDSAERESSMTFQELMSFLYEEVIRDVPVGWVKLEIDSELGTDAVGRQEIHTTYRYSLEGEQQSHRFTTTNIFGPMNAISEIESLMSKEGRGWKKGRFTFYPDGKLSLNTDEDIL